jgi:hypothetical protein
LDASRVRTTASLGDQTGLTKLGIHKTTLTPNMVSTVEHFHDNEDEWFYILQVVERLSFHRPLILAGPWNFAVCRQRRRRGGCCG